MRKKEERKRDAGQEERRPFCVRVERLGMRVAKRRGEARKGCEERKRATMQGERGGVAVASGSCEGGGGMSSSGERGSPCGGCVEEGCGKGGRAQREKRAFLWGMPRERGYEDGVKELGGRELFFSGRTQGK